MMATTSWDEVKAARAGDSAVEAAYAAAKLAFELGMRVRAMREERGWSQRDLAKLTGMTQPSIARFEAGGTNPTLPILERIANAFDTTVSVELKPKAVA
jgi:DNA-binding XRE family transcriptional regulator